MEKTPKSYNILPPWQTKKIQEWSLICRLSHHFYIILPFLTEQKDAREVG